MSCRVPTAKPTWRRWISPRRSESTPTSALDTAVRYLAQRPRSEYEVRKRLQRSRVDDATIDATVEQLRRHQLLDDRAFAEYWVEQRQTFRPRGARLIQSELSRLGVTRASADDATAVLADSAQEDAFRAGYKRAKQLRSLEQRAFETRLGQWLARRGFDWDTITAVVARLWAETAAG